MANKKTFKIHLFDLLAAMLFLGKKVTPEDIANHLYDTCWASEDKYDILSAVNKAFDREMANQDGKRPEDHYGLRKHPTLELYWLSYNVDQYE